MYLPLIQVILAVYGIME